MNPKNLEKALRNAYPGISPEDLQVMVACLKEIPGICISSKDYSMDEVEKYGGSIHMVFQNGENLSPEDNVDQKKNFYFLIKDTDGYTLEQCSP